MAHWIWKKKDTIFEFKFLHSVIKLSITLYKTYNIRLTTKPNAWYIFNKHITDFLPQNLIFLGFFSKTLFCKGFPRNLSIFRGFHRFSMMMQPGFLEHLTKKKKKKKIWKHRKFWATLMPGKRRKKNKFDLPWDWIKIYKFNKKWKIRYLLQTSWRKYNW